MTTTQWSEGLTQADRQADWDKMTPMWRELARRRLDGIVSSLVLLPPDEAARVAQETLDFFDFGDFDDLLDRARAFT